MRRALFLIGLALGVGVQSASARTLGYVFDSGTEVMCAAPHAGATDLPGGLHADHCAETVTFTPVGGGLPVHISGFPMFGQDARGGVNVLPGGIGYGSDGQTRVNSSPGGLTVSRGPTASDPGYAEKLVLDFEIPVRITQISVRSYTTADQYLLVLTPDGPAGGFKYNGARSGAVHTGTFSTALVGSTFTLDPLHVLDDEDGYGGFLLAGVTVVPTPVPPALALLGGAIALLAWRARRARAA